MRNAWRLSPLWVLLACGPKQQAETQGDDATQEVTVSPTAHQDSAVRIVEKIGALETERDVTCWTSFRQLDSFIATKAYSPFATMTKIVAVKRMARAVWLEASEGKTVVTGADVLAAAEARLASLPSDYSEEELPEDLARQFRDYKTTSEHWRVLLSLAQDQLRAPDPALAPLDSSGEDAMADVATQLSIALLRRSGDKATQERAPLIESRHVKQALGELELSLELAELAPRTALDETATKPLMALTKTLVDRKISALRTYNKSSDDLRAEINRVSKVPLDEAAFERMYSELKSMAGFLSRGFEPMRSDNHLSDGSYAPKSLDGRDYIDYAYVENAIAQIFPHVTLPNGDLRLRFEPRPGTISEGVEAQEFSLLDHEMNAVRDTALHWAVLQDVWNETPYAMDPFAAEYVSEMVSVVAAYYLRRLDEIAGDAEGATAQMVGRVRDPRLTMVLAADESSAPVFTQEQRQAKKALLESLPSELFADATSGSGLPVMDAVALEAAKDGDFDIQVAMGSGIAVGDIDGDRYPDVFIAGAGMGRLYRNRGAKAKGMNGRFEDVTEAWGLPTENMGDSRGALFWDSDGDGDSDLVILRSREPSLMLENTGKRFEDRTEAAGFAPGRGAHTATAFDADSDGDLDLYIGFYGSAACNAPAGCEGRNLPSLDGLNGKPNQLWRNDSKDDGPAFVEVAAELGLDDLGWTLAASPWDLENDGDLDLYLANDFGHNALYVAENGTYREVGASTYTDDRGSGMNVSFGDVDGDGLLDVYVSNIDMFSKTIKVVFPSDASTIDLDDAVIRSFQYISGNKLYKAGPTDKPLESIESTFFEPGDRGWGWAGVFVDIDNDADEDFYLTNGWIPGSPAADQRNQLYVRDDETLWLVEESRPSRFAGNSRSAVSADFDRDGDLDLLVTNFQDGPTLLDNRLAKSDATNWIRLRLEHDAPNVDAVGATIEVTTGEKKQVRNVSCGEGYLGQRAPSFLFGLGKEKTADVRIRWPDGTTEAFEKLSAACDHRIRRSQPPVSCE